MTQLSISTGIGLSMFYTLSGLLTLFIFLPKNEATNKYFYGLIIGIPLILGGIYYFLLFWTTFKTDNQKLIIEQKTIFKTEIKEFEAIKKLILYPAKGGYILHVESTDEGKSMQYSDFSKSNSKEIRSFLEKLLLKLSIDRFIFYSSSIFGFIESTAANDFSICFGVISSILPIFYFCSNSWVLSLPTTSSFL